MTKENKPQISFKEIKEVKTKNGNTRIDAVYVVKGKDERVSFEYADATYAAHG